MTIRGNGTTKGTEEVTSEPDRETIPLPLLAARLAERLSHLAALSIEMQDILSQCEFGAPDTRMIRGMQHLDLISQSLEDYAGILEAIAAEAPEDVRFHAEALLAAVRRHDSHAVVHGNRPEPDPMPEGNVFWL